MVSLTAKYLFFLSASLKLCAGRPVCIGHYGYLWCQYLCPDHRHHGDDLHHVGLRGEQLLQRCQRNAGLYTKHLLQGNCYCFMVTYMSSIDLKSQACWAFFSPAILAVIFIAAAASWQKPSYGEVLYPGVLLQVHTSDSLLCLLRLASWDWLGSHPPVLGTDSVVDAGHHCGCRRAG